MKQENYVVSSVHLKMVRERKKLYCEETLTSPQSVAKMVDSLFKDLDREKMILISVNANLEPVAYEIIAVGGTSSCTIDIKSIFKHALLANATGIIVVHNHPSLNPRPSVDDERITEKIKQAGKFLDVELIDHIVFGTVDQFYSFKQHDWKIERGETA